MPPPYHTMFYRLDAIPLAQPTVSKHTRKLLSKVTYERKLARVS